MELFKNAKAVRLRSHHEKYLLADEDEECVYQDRHGSSKKSRWYVEPGCCDTVLRLKSCYGKYLTATETTFLLGVTGKKVMQTIPSRLDSSVEWEPIREGFHVRLKTRYGNFLRANGGVPPWRNSITHDIPHRTATQDWVLWEVDVLDHRPKSLDFNAKLSHSFFRSASSIPDTNLPSIKSFRSPSFSCKMEAIDQTAISPTKEMGRDVHYSVVEGNQEETNDGGGDDGDDDRKQEESMMRFKGNSVEKLKEELEKATGLENITICSKNPLNGKLYPLRLALPPNIATMHIFIVKSCSSL